mmetsp:Transcript_39424/g.93453  ORF Transcript_39424/g.93453 Transcript_39424/m.93453 type:complete len:234 (-) Transcript_39424:332-1033(-)
MRPAMDALRLAGCCLQWTAPRALRAMGSPRGSIGPVSVRTGPFPGFPTDLQPQMTALLALADGVSSVEETVFEARLRPVPAAPSLSPSLSRNEARGTEQQQLQHRGEQAGRNGSGGSARRSAIALAPAANSPALRRCLLTLECGPGLGRHAAQLRRMGAVVEETGRRSLRIEGRAALRGCEVKAADLRGGAALVVAGLAAEGTTRILEPWHIDRGYDRIEEKLRAVGADVARV